MFIKGDFRFLCSVNAAFYVPYSVCAGKGDCCHKFASNNSPICPYSLLRFARESMTFLFSRQMRLPCTYNLLLSYRYYPLVTCFVPVDAPT